MAVRVLTLRVADIPFKHRAQLGGVPVKCVGEIRVSLLTNRGTPPRRNAVPECLLLQSLYFPRGLLGDLLIIASQGLGLVPTVQS